MTEATSAADVTPSPFAGGDTTLGYGDVVAGPTWILEAGALSIIGWLMFGWSMGVLVWILGRHYERIFPSDPDRRASASP